MTKTLLCFGDSNTHGSPPIIERGRAYERFDDRTRWPCIAAAALAPDWTIIEEGLPGRTAQFDDPIMGAHMNGQPGLRIALCSHGPIDAMTLMLGTNDVKTRFGATPEMVTAGIASLLDIALGDEMQARHGGFKVLVICPPPVLEQGPIMGEFFGARATSLELPALYADLAHARGCGFLDAGQHIAVSPVDGIHYDPPAHRVLGEAIAEAIGQL